MIKEISETKFLFVQQVLFVPLTRVGKFAHATYIIFFIVFSFLRSFDNFKSHQFSLLTPSEASETYLGNIN